MQSRRSYLIVIGLVVAALVGVALLAVPGSPVHRKPTLGLDLQGGLEVVLKAVPPKGHVLTQDDLDRSVTIMRNRVDQLGVSEPEIRKQGSDQIIIQLAGVHDPKKAAQIIGKTAQLELYDLEADLTGPSVRAQGLNRIPVATPRLYDLLAAEQLKAKKGTPEAYYLFDRRRRVIAGPANTREQLFTPRHPSVPRGGKVLAVPQNTAVVTCVPTPTNGCPGSTAPGATYYYLFRHDLGNKNEFLRVPEMTGGDLKASGTQADTDQFGQPIVRMAFTSKGDHKFQDITRRLWQRGNTVRSPQHFAIVLDNRIESAPQIDFTNSSLSSGISGGAEITNIGSFGEASDLALVLKTGALPVSYTQIERTDVSATLGKDSLQQAKTAALIGLLVVAIFLLVLYRFLGLVAVIGLLIYAAFLYGAILLLNVTLTLPGFAGLILTIGVAADANVVVFERIKEEVRAGKSVRSAINTGYAKGFHTIIDANVVTCITAMVLFAFATAQVKGFALMLLVGTVISLLTAVVATRAMLGLLAGFSWFDNPRFMGASPVQHGKWLQIDFIGKRRLWFAISGTIIALGIVSLATQGLNLGIDFKGGTQIAFKTPRYVPISSVRDQAKAIGHADAIVQGRGSSSGDAYKSFQIRTKSLTRSQQDTLTTNLQNRLGAASLGIKSVSSSFGHQIAIGALWAIFGSLLLISLYIALRFDYKFALPVLVALLHDIAITIGVYSLTGREVTTATVAAVLTVLGYSIYDTIIIFDRVRENIPLMRRASFKTIANVSLWETIRRSLATTFITLLPITSLLLFGGATLKDFAFALFVGIVSGAYSSIFIAAPLLAMWKQREPEFKRRVDSDVIDLGVGAVGPEREQVAPAAEAPAVEAEPEAALVAPAAPTAGGDAGGAKAQSKRERRRQRRRSRPHGRSR